ncbi:hypothetical protein EON65_25360 [archaeon]|nr:MAG: hypothetical protein EON65_25360 [archaeon]
MILFSIEEVQETTRLLLQRTLAYASLFSLSKCQFATCAELSRALLVLSYDSHTNSTSSDVSNVWIMRSLAWGGMGHAPLALVHYKNAASSSSSGSNSESTPATSSTPFPASQLAITKYLEQQELAHAHIYTHSSTPSLVLHELDRILRSMGAGDASMCSVLTESPDLEEVHVKEYQSVLSHTPSHTPLSSHTPSQTPSLSDGILDMITKAVCAGDDKKGSGGRDGGGSRSIYTLYGKVIANTLLSKIKSRGQMKGENGGSSDVDSVSSVICMLGQVIYHLLVTSFYEAQTLFQEHLYLSAQIRYTLCRACVGILKSESVYVKAITKVVCGVPCSNEGINMHYDKVAEEIKAYIDSIDRASMCNLWMCGDKLGSSNNSKVVVDELIGPVEQVRSLAHCVKANR